MERFSRAPVIALAVTAFALGAPNSQTSAQVPAGTVQIALVRRPRVIFAAMAQPAASKRKRQTLAATVRQISGQTVIAEMTDTRFLVIQLSPSTRIISAPADQGAAPDNLPGAPARPVALRPGLQIKVTASVADAHAIQAELIEVVGTSPAAPLPSAQKPEPAQTKPSAQLPSGTDTTIAKAREIALRFVQKLPDFTCLETVERWRQRCGHCGQWNFQDQLTAELLYNDKTGESYRNLHVNHVPVTTSLYNLNGQITKGEFASTVKSLFADTADTDFEFIKETSDKGRKERLYKYRVSRERSEWLIGSDYQFVLPSYAGRVWIDVATGHIMRLERQAQDIPEAFPFIRVDSDVEFGEVRLGDSELYFLPKRGHSEICLRENDICTRNDIDFSRYHKYTGESTIHFQ